MDGIYIPYGRICGPNQVERSRIRITCHCVEIQLPAVTQNNVIAFTALQGVTAKTAQNNVIVFIPENAVCRTLTLVRGLNQGDQTTCQSNLSMVADQDVLVAFCFCYGIAISVTAIEHIPGCTAECNVIPGIAVDGIYIPYARICGPDQIKRVQVIITCVVIEIPVVTQDNVIAFIALQGVIGKTAQNNVIVFIAENLVCCTMTLVRGLNALDLIKTITGDSTEIAKYDIVTGISGDIVA